MKESVELVQKIGRYVRPETLPVAVAFLPGETSLPSRARRPLRDLGVRMAPCQGAAMARRYGWTVAFTREDVGCAIAAHTYSWERAEEKAVIAFLRTMQYSRDEESARAALTGFRQLDLGPDLAVLYAPLEKVAWDIHVVLIYCNPAQLMRLIHGATFGNGKALLGTFSGRASSCTEGVIGAYLDGVPKIVVPGNGDRVWAGCQDHEVLMAIPAAILSEVVEGLEKTHEKGIRYPIPTYLRYAPEVAFALPLSEIFKEEGLQKLRP